MQPMQPMPPLLTMNSVTVAAFMASHNTRRYSFLLPYYMSFVSQIITTIWMYGALSSLAANPP
jgi:hypothetical protein